MEYELHYLSYHGLMNHITKLINIEKLIDQKDDQGSTPLHLACAQNHTEVTKYLISLGADVNSQDKNLSTALHWVVYNNNIELVKFLIERNANVKIQDSNGIQPIHLAALKGHIENIKILTPKVKNGEIIDKLGITPLHLASHCGHHNVIQILLENECFDVDANDLNAIKPLYLALGSNHITSAKLLLEKGALSSCFDSYGRSPMHWAAVNGNVEALNSIICNYESLCDFNHLDDFKCNPLFLATSYGHDEVVNILLQNNHALNLESGQREMYLILTNLEGPDGIINKYFNELENTYSLPNTLHWAAAFCSKKIVEQLLDNGADIEEKGIHGNTPLHTAASFGNKDVVELLIDRGAQLDPLDKNESTPLHWAVAHCHLEVIQLLLDEGADEKNALCWAAACGNLNVAKLLIENECDVNEEDGNEEYIRTPLIWAATCGHSEMFVYLLIELKAEITNYDILHWCAFNGMLDCLKMLIERGIDVNEPDLCFKWSALHWAAIAGKVDITKFLLNVDGIRVSGSSFTRNSSLHYAVMNNRYEIIQMLIEHGADIDECTYLGVPLHMAVEAGDLDAVKILVEGGADLTICFIDLPLNLAVKFGHMDIVDYLFEKSIEKQGFIHNLAKYRPTIDLMKYMKPEDVNALDDDELQTPLFYAILGNGDNVKFLIDNGANVNHKDEVNRTPLHVAILDGKFECVKMLIDNGADINIETPAHSIMLAIHTANLDILKLLIDKYNANINIVSDNLWNPLHYAADIRDNDVKKLKIIEYLLSKNININVTDCQGKTPLYVAMNSVLNNSGIFNYSDEFSSDIIQLLLNNDANINIKTCEGRTTLSSAVNEKAEKYVKLLILHGADVNLDRKMITYCTKKNDIPILDLLYNAGLHLTNIPQSVRDKYDLDVQSFITYAETNPLNLKQICRIICQKTFGKNYLNTVKCLLLPNILKKYLLFDEI